VKILLAGYFSTFWHEEAWVRALTELGHQVTPFRMSAYFSRNVFGRIQNRFVYGPAVNKLNADLLEQVRMEMPEVVLCYRALPVKHETVERLVEEGRASNRIVVSYNNDNAYGELSSKAYWRLYRRSVPYFDLHLAYRDADLAHLGSSSSAYVLHPHNMPWLHRVLPDSELSGWKSDICFLGHYEPDRRQHELNALMRAVPATYSLHGSLWGKNSRHMAWHGMDTRELQGEDYVRALNGAKIALVFFSTWNADTFTRRVFEIPACGTMMLSQRTDTMLGLYAEDKEAIYYESVDELIDKARFYLKNDTSRRKIAEAGFKRCQTSGYDIYSRMSEWIKLIEPLRLEKQQAK
jgi:spore maturation protein CgeB